LLRYNETVFTKLFTNKSTTYLNNMRRPKAGTDEFALIGNMFYFQLDCPDCAILLEKGHHAPSVVNFKGFFSVPHYETLQKL